MSGGFFDTAPGFSNSSKSISGYAGSGLSAAGDLFSGVGGIFSGEASASYDKFMQRVVDESTNLKLAHQERQGYMLQSQAQADIGANGLAMGGSAEDIVRMNAQNLALENAAIQQSGAIEAGGWGIKARAASGAGIMGAIEEGVKAAGTIALAFA